MLLLLLFSISISKFNHNLSPFLFAFIDLISRVIRSLWITINRSRLIVDNLLRVVQYCSTSLLQSNANVLESIEYCMCIAHGKLIITS